MNDNIHMNTEIEGSMNDNITLKWTLKNRRVNMNDNINFNMDTTHANRRVNE